MIGMDIPYEVTVAGPQAVATYRRSVAAGGSEKFAAMCALQTPPGSKGSDRAFMEGRMNNQQLDDMPRLQAEYVARDARKAGINISGKYYCGGLADGRGWKDPEAWVGSNDDVLRVAKKRGKSVTGAVNYDAGPAPPPKRVALSERIIKEEVAHARKLNPGLKDTPELREKIIEKHAHPKLRGK
jgi:hypothetical protein